MEAFDASGRTMQQKLLELQQLVEDEAATGVGFNHQLSVDMVGYLALKCCYYYLIFKGMKIHDYYLYLFICELQGYMGLSHSHIVINLQQFDSCSQRQGPTPRANAGNVSE